MDRWIFYAIVSMVFAGFTSVIAKLGLVGISGELGIGIRTAFVFAFVTLFAFAAVEKAELQHVSWSNILWLAISAITTAISWVYYYKAIKVGEVATVALIDKASFVIAVLMAWVVLGERITWRIALGSTLILAGLYVVSRR